VPFAFGRLAIVEKCIRRVCIVHHAVGGKVKGRKAKYVH